MSNNQVNLKHRELESAEDYVSMDNNIIKIHGIDNETSPTYETITTCKSTAP